MPIVKYNESDLINNPENDKLPAHGFVRSLAFWKDLIIVGSYLATVTLYSKKNIISKSINLSMDAINSVHGVCIID